MLSKLWLIVSGGRNAATSTVMPRRSLIDAAYSARLSRWNVRRPGFGRVTAAASIRVSSAEASAVTTAGSGRSAPAGGIMPARSLRIIFSATSAVWSARAGSNVSSTRPPFAPPLSWHSRQNSLMTAFCASTDISEGVCAGVIGTAFRLIRIPLVRDGCAVLRAASARPTVLSAVMPMIRIPTLSALQAHFGIVSRLNAAYTPECSIDGFRRPPFPFFLLGRILPDPRDSLD
jgi:hypothetical protein